MSLLDSDADELKARAQGSTSGRKTNQSGLGAFKGLSKYAALTSKYRTKGAETPVENKSPEALSSVEHRGTIQESEPDLSKSVQRQGASAPTLIDLEINKEDSQVSASSHPPVVIEENIKSQQSPSINALTLEFDCLDGTKKLSENESQCKDALTLIFNEFQDVTDFIESQCNNAPTVNVDTTSIKSKIAKSVQSQFTHAPTKDVRADSRHHKYPNSTQLKQSKFEAARTLENSLQAQVTSQVSALVGAALHSLKDKAGAESVQSPCEVGAIVSAKIRPLDVKELVPLVSILTLSGSQRILLEFLFDQCVFNNSLITPPITKEQLLRVTSLKEETALSSIKRLRSKFLIDRSQYKDGKAGWTKYKLSEITYKEIINFRNSKSPFAGPINFEAHNVRAKVGAGVRANPPSKIDSNLNNVSILTNAPTLSAPTNTGWFKTLDFSLVAPISPMQVNTSIRNLVESQLTFDDVQNFINRFLPWLSTQSKVNNVIAIFCDRLKEYAREGDSAVLYVMTEAEIKLESELAKRALNIRQEREFIQKEKELEVLSQKGDEFEKWYTEASDQELLELQKSSAFLEFRSELYKKMVKSVYLERGR